MDWVEKIDCRAFSGADFLEIHPKAISVVKDRSLKT